MLFTFVDCCCGRPRLRPRPQLNPASMRALSARVRRWQCYRMPTARVKRSARRRTDSTVLRCSTH
jgi:hypothetical protein